MIGPQNWGSGMHCHGRVSQGNSTGFSGAAAAVDQALDKHRASQIARW